MDEAVGYVTDIVENESFSLIVPFEKTYLLDKRQITECSVRIDDGRSISALQRKHIYATFNDIAKYTGYTPDETKQVMKYSYIALTGQKEFSLSDCSMTVARDFLEYLIEFCIEEGIPTKDNLIERSPDISRYIYCCLANKTCCITGEKAKVQLHHVDAVGMGRNRKDIIHHGMRVMPLRWDLHAEAHRIGQKSFDEKYKVFGIKLDEYLCKIWKVKYK